MTPFLTYLTEGTRIFLNSWKSRFIPKKYPGKAKEICQQIVDDCWNGNYFQTSTGNFRQFWCRDFFWVTKSLLNLGYQKKVQKTLRYALNRFRKANQITTTLTPRGKPFDFPTAAVDSLPSLIHSMKLAKFNYYDYKDFLNQEISKFYSKIIDPKTGLVKANKHFSSIKDLSIRTSSCYDNCLVALLAKDLQSLKLNNPFKKFNYAQLIKDHFWNGKYFYDDLQKQDYVAGDANLFPFILGIIADKEMMKKSVQAITEAKLDEPFPLKYTQSREKINFVWEEFFLRNYESDAIWMHLGPLYVKFLQHVDQERAKELKEKYTKLIEQHHNFLEVFTAEGKPYHSWFYYCDSGMLWAANYLEL